MNATTASTIERAAEGIGYLNLGQFAKVVGSTEPTVRKRVEESDGGSWLIERGSKGRDYRIHPVLGLEWWRGEEARRREAEEAEEQAVEQLAMAFLGPNALKTEAQGLSAAEQLKLLEVQKALRLEAQARGSLVDREQFVQLMGNTLSMLTRRILAAAKAVAREADLKPVQRSAWEEAVEQAINAAIDSCQERLKRDA